MYGNIRLDIYLFKVTQHNSCVLDYFAFDLISTSHYCRKDEISLTLYVVFRIPKEGCIQNGPR